MRQILNYIVDFYQFIILPFLSISIFFAMEYMSRGAEFFFKNDKVRWRFLGFCAFMQFFVSVVIIWSVKAVFETDPLLEYETMKMIAILLLGTTPFNISILIWVAIKLEIYRIMRSRYEKELKEVTQTHSLLEEALIPKMPEIKSSKREQAISKKENKRKKKKDIEENNNIGNDTQDYIDNNSQDTESKSIKQSKNKDIESRSISNKDIANKTDSKDSHNKDPDL